MEMLIEIAMERLQEMEKVLDYDEDPDLPDGRQREIDEGTLTGDLTSQIDTEG
jgi:hypothetical protein